MIQIVTDSTANLPNDLVRKHNIVVVPLKVHLDCDTFYEGVDLTPEEFFRRLPTANPLPTTSQPSPLDFEKVYSSLLSQSEKQEVISLHISSELSATYNSASQGAMKVDESRISVMDSRTVSAGLCLLVLAAVRMIETGQSRSEIMKKLASLTKEMQLVFTLDTLEYLRRGGRIGNARAFLGGLLRIKPTIKLENGRLEAGKRTRSRRKAIELLLAEPQDSFKTNPVWVALADAMAEDVDVLETLVHEKLNVQKLVHCQIGPVVATHTGPNTLGLAVIPALA